MHVIETLSDLPVALPTACALGMFDGVHLGHRMVLENALRQARQHGLIPVVVSFSNHPQALLAATPTPLLSSCQERLALFEALGVEIAVMIPFDPALRAMAAPAFARDILRARLRAQHVSVGYDYRFGAGRQGDCEALRQYGAREGFAVHVIDPVRAQAVDGHGIVSSTLIRKLLNFGDVRQANALLGRPYALEGTVCQGVQRGRQLGFPTANLAIASQRLIPAVGAYAAQAILDQTTYAAVCNIGHAPTFAQALDRRVEVHLLDYDGPAFYGASLRLAFLERLRDERRFPSAEALMAQIHQDCADARCHV